MARQLLNNATDVVEEMLHGVTLTNPAVRQLEGYNVIVRADIDRSKVAIVSGGGSGHEPSHAGWVGPGMLTAAVAGSGPDPKLESSGRPGARTSIHRPSTKI